MVQHLLKNHQLHHFQIKFIIFSLFLIVFTPLTPVPAKSIRNSPMVHKNYQIIYSNIDLPCISQDTSHTKRPTPIQQHLKYVKSGKSGKKYKIELAKTEENQIQIGSRTHMDNTIKDSAHDNPTTLEESTNKHVDSLQQTSYASTPTKLLKIQSTTNFKFHQYRQNFYPNGIHHLHCTNTKKQHIS